MSVYFEELDFRPTPIGVLSLQAATAALDRHRHLRDQARRRVPDVEPVHCGRNRTGAAGLAALIRRSWREAISMSSSAGSGSATPRRPCSNMTRSASPDRGRCAGRGDRMARAGVAADRKTTQRRPALPPRSWRLLRDDDVGARVTIRGAPGRRFDAVLVDIDHSPRNLLHPRHAALYSRHGLARLAGHLHPGGVFALWSNDPPDDAFMAALASGFATPAAHVVTFPDAQGDRRSQQYRLCRRQTCLIAGDRWRIRRAPMRDPRACRP